MPPELEVELKLKQILTDPLDDEKPLRDVRELDMDLDELQRMTPKQAYAKSPEIRLGTVLNKIINEGVQPKDAKGQAKQYRLSVKIQGLMSKDKGIWKMDEDQLKDLKSTLDTAKGQYAMPKYLGQIYDKLESLSDEITAKKKKTE